MSQSLSKAGLTRVYEPPDLETLKNLQDDFSYCHVDSGAPMKSGWTGLSRKIRAAPSGLVSPSKKTYNALKRVSLDSFFVL